MNQNFIERFHELPGHLANHLMITVIALSAGVLVGVPVAIALSRSRRWRYPVLTAAGVIQTIPSLALLALMVPLLGTFGFWPAVIALSLYSLLPVLRNTVTGMLGVDPAMIEAARGVGMTSRQTLCKVELPLSAPVIIAGIRTSTVWVVGIATLATPVGQRCLGNYIFTGLQTRNWTMVMFGVVSAASLAVLLDLLIGGLQRAAEQRNRPLGLFSGTALALIVLSGLVSPTLVRLAGRTAPLGSATASRDQARPDIATPIRIGTKTFTEQYILADLINQTLTAARLKTRRVESLGSTVAFDALTNGNIDLYVDYSGTIWANYMGRETSAAPWKVLDIVSGWLADVHGIRCLGTLGFENAYALAMRREQVTRLGVRTIGDLAPHARTLSIGGDYEFFGRPEWTAIRRTYKLRFRTRRSFDSSLMYEALARGDVDVISAFTSDGRVQTHDFVLLDDPNHAIPPYDALILLGPTVAGREDVVRALQPLVGSIPINLMRRANHMADRQENKKTIHQAARWLAEATGARAPSATRPVSATPAVPRTTQTP